LGFSCRNPPGVRIPGTSNAPQTRSSRFVYV